MTSSTWYNRGLVRILPHVLSIYFGLLSCILCWNTLNLGGVFSNALENSLKLRHRLLDLSRSSMMADLIEAARITILIDNLRLTTMQLLHVPSVCRSRQNFSHRCFGWYFFENSKKNRIRIRWPIGLVRKKNIRRVFKNEKVFFRF